MTTQLPSSGEMAEVVEQVVSTLDGLRAEPCAASELGRGEEIWTAWVSMGGGFDGAVTLHCSEVLAQSIAASMLATPADEVPDDASKDAFGELAHVIAGNIKSLITPPSAQVCVLLGRKVLAGLVGVPGGTSRREAWLACGQQRLCVKLWESRNTVDAGARPLG